MKTHLKRKDMKDTQRSILRIQTEFGIWGSLIFFFFSSSCSVSGILVPWPGMEPGLPSMDARSPNHRTAKEFPGAPRFSVSNVDIASNLGEILMWFSLYWCSETSESIDNSTVWKTKKIIFNQLVCRLTLVYQIETTISFSHETLKYLPKTGLQRKKKNMKEKPTYV